MKCGYKASRWKANGIWYMIQNFRLQSELGSCRSFQEYITRVEILSIRIVEQALMISLGHHVIDCTVNIFLHSVSCSLCVVHTAYIK